MNIPIPDPLESAERAADDWAFDNIREVNGELIFICPGCEKEKPLKGAALSSPNPYSLPICRECFDEKKKEEDDHVPA